MNRVPRPDTAPRRRPALAATTAMFLATTLVRLSGREVRGWSPALAFVPWMAPGGALLAILARVRGVGGPAGPLLAASAAALSTILVPRARRQRQPHPEGGQTVTIMSANVFKGAADAEALVALVRAHRPDILAVQEQSPRYVRALRDAGLFELMPHHIAGDGSRMNDAGLWSVHPVAALGLRLPSEFIDVAVTLPGGRVVPVISAHPLPPASLRTERRWSQTIAALPSPSGPFAGGLVAGDFNATLDHPQFRALLARGWRDAGRELGQGLRATWRGERIGLLRLHIDHILVPPGAGVSAYRIDPLAGSDHLTLTATVVLPPM